MDKKNIMTIAPKIDGNYERRDRDAYFTPSWCTEALLDHVKFQEKIWEPACGNGAISKILIERGYDVYSTDIHQYEDSGYFKPCVLDFLITEGSNWNRDIITNPPYNLCQKFLERAVIATCNFKGKVAMLLRNEWDSAKTRNYLFTDYPFMGKIVLTKRPVWIEGPQKASPRHNFSWFIWDWKHKGPPILMYQKT